MSQMSNYKINPFIYEKNKSLFSGVGVASVTPFDNNGGIDLNAIDRLCEYFFLGVLLCRCSRNYLRVIHTKQRRKRNCQS